MNALIVTAFACAVVLGSTDASRIWGAHGGYDYGYVHGHGHLPPVGASGVVSSGGAAGPTGVVNGHGAVDPNGIPNAVHGDGLLGVGIGAHAIRAWNDGDDGQWHGEGLLASQDWAGHGAGIVVAPGIVGAHGLGLGHINGHGHGW